MGGSDAKAACGALRRLAAQEKTPPPLHLVAATPGRLRALLEVAETPLNMPPGVVLSGFPAVFGGFKWCSEPRKSLELLVFDEADSLLKLGFAMDVQAILQRAPKQRRTGLFSATLTTELQRLMKAGMRHPVHVCVRLKRPSEAPVGGALKVRRKAPEAIEDKEVKSHEVPTKLLNYHLQLKATERLGFLRHFLQREEVRKGKSIVFFLTCATVDYFHVLLRQLIDEKGGKKGKKPEARKGL